MKRIFVALIISLVALSASAQEHLKVKGIPIDGSVSSFAAKLRAAGCKTDTRLSDALGTPVLVGDFAGLSGCKFSFIADNDNTVCKVIIISKDFTGWINSKSEYNDMKALLNTKYNMVNHFEFFSNPYYEGDGYELSAVRQEKAVYKSYFECPEGYIALELNATSSSEGYLTIVYEDRINTEKFSAEREKKISDDI